MRTAGIILIALGMLTMAWGLVAEKGADPDPDVARAIAEERRFNGMLFGGALMVGGVILISLDHSRKPVQAVASEQWISIPVTDDAASFVHSEMQIRRFPSGSGVRIVRDDSADQLAVKFDLPSDDADDCVGESKGVSVFVNKALAPLLSDRCIDLCDGSLVVAAAKPLP